MQRLFSLKYWNDPIARGIPTTSTVMKIIFNLSYLLEHVSLTLAVSFQQRQNISFVHYISSQSKQNLATTANKGSDIICYMFQAPCETWQAPAPTASSSLASSSPPLPSSSSSTTAVRSGQDTGPNGLTSRSFLWPHGCWTWSVVATSRLRSNKSDF